MSLHTGTVSRPRYESRPYKPSPARREAIYGRIQDDLPTPRSPLTLACNVAVVAMFVVVAGLCAARGWAW